MKHITTTFAVLLFIFTAAHAQSPFLPEEMHFTNQTQIDNFHSEHPDCTMIEGDVYISGCDITNLHGLNPLTAVGGDFLLIGNERLTDLAGLENLVSVSGALYIGSSAISTGNDSLISLKGLDNITAIGGMFQIAYNQSLKCIESLRNLAYVGGYLDINNNPCLLSLKGLENLQAVKLLAIYQNDILCNLSGLENLRQVDLELFIGQNNSLTSLHGLNNIESVEGLVDIWDNPQLRNLDGLGGLISIGGYIWISENDSLLSLVGLEALVSVAGEIALNDNISLNSLRGLDNIPASSILALNIHDNKSLSDCALQNICTFLSSPMNLGTFHGNAQGCKSMNEIIEDCESKGQNDESEYLLKIKPNPCFSDNIHLILENVPPNLRFRCFNTFGKQIHQQEISSTETMLDVSNWTSGIYLAVLYAENRLVGNAKFIVY